MKGLPLSGCLPGELERFLEAIDPALCSHLEKSLKTHLGGVTATSIALHSHLELPINERLISLVALSHDIGKANPEFQSYLLNEDIHKGPNHAAPSAWWTWALGWEMGLPMADVFWGAEAVRRHHTHLQDFKTIHNYWDDDAANRTRLESWRRAQALLPQYRTAFEKDGLPEFTNLFWDLDQDPGLQNWLDFRLLYSILIASDRLDALGIQDLTLHQPPQLHEPKFDNTQTNVNLWRQTVHEACYKSAMDRIVRPGVYSLTLPTGSGKTYTGLRIAADLAQRLSLSSLIYVLPFISIVDQTASFARQCFNPDEIQEDHSLRPIQFEDGYHPLQHMRAMFRYWHQPVIITTLAQFWEAVFSAPANRTMNFHRLANAVILLDEPQSLAPKYWQGLGELLEYLSDRLGSVFILMTATQPQITQYAGSGGELAPSVYHFPEIRHHYRIDGVDERQTLDDLMALIEDEGLLHDRPAGMVVLNTKKCALAVYDRIHTVADSTLKDHVLFLSAWLTPYRREKLLRRLRELEEQDSPRILVATQVVEAGVDLDFDWVIRDMGPFDSIVQVAGRCNRHQKRAHQGRVYVLNLEDEQTGRSFASYIYDTILLEATREVLRGRTRFDERDVPELIRRYYNAITDRLTPSDIVRQLRVGAWDQPFPLYPEKDVLQMQLIVEETDEVAGLVNKLENTHWRLATLTQKKALMQKLRQHMIDIPAKYRSSMALVCAQIASNEPLLQDINNGKMVMMSEHLIFNQAGPEGQSYLYHPIKGFIPPDEESLARPLTF